MDQGFDFTSFNIMDTKELGNYDAAEDFLNSGEDGVPATTKAPVIPKKPEAKKEDEEEAKEEETQVDVLGELEDKKKEEGKEETKEDEKKEDEKKEDEKEQEDEGKNTYEALYKDLLELGVFRAKEGEKPAATGEELLAKFQQEGQDRATDWLDSFLGQFDDGNKELFQAIFIDGVSPEEYLPVHNQVQNFESLDITVEDNQKKVFREFYRRIGMDEDKIEKKLQKAIDYGDLESETPDLHERILAQDKEALEQQRTQATLAQQQKQRADAEYKTGIQKLLVEASKNKEFKGVPVNEKRAKEAFDYMYTPKYKTPNGGILTEFDRMILESKKPENLQDRLLITLLKLDGFDFKNIKKQALSEENKELFNSLAQKVTKDKTRATKSSAQAKDEESSIWVN